MHMHYKRHRSGLVRLSTRAVHIGRAAAKLMGVLGSEGIQEPAPQTDIRKSPDVSKMGTTHPVTR